ncbi:MAG: pilin [Candidatus Magasanikiibacteriota bacterium]
MNLSKIKKILLLIICLTSLFVGVQNVKCENIANIALEELKDNVVKPAGYKPENSNLNTVIGRLIKTALTLVGVAFFIFMVYAGFKWMTAQGNEEQVKGARDTMIAAVIGVVVLAGSYGISNLIFTGISENNISTGGGGGPNAGDAKVIGCCLDWMLGSEDRPIVAARVEVEQVCIDQQASDGLWGDPGKHWGFYENLDNNDLCGEIKKECWNNKNNDYALLLGPNRTWEEVIKPEIAKCLSEKVTEWSKQGIDLNKLKINLGKYHNF